jgi:hypothetical protein
MPVIDALGSRQCPECIATAAGSLIPDRADIRVAIDISKIFLFSNYLLILKKLRMTIKTPSRKHNLYQVDASLSDICVSPTIEP